MRATFVTPTTLCVICDRGENLQTVLADIAETYKLPSASISGIGTMKKITLGYLDPHTSSYIKKYYEEEFELISCQGNLSWMDNKPFIHLHVLISGPQFEVHGGHLFSSEIGLTGEFFLHIGEVKVERFKRGEFGLIELPS